MDPRSASQEKLRYTREWGIPVVSADWLYISIRVGRKKAFEAYIVQDAGNETPQLQYEQQQQQLDDSFKHADKKKKRRHVDDGLRDRSASQAEPEQSSEQVQQQQQQQQKRKRQIEPVDGDGFLKGPSRKGGSSKNGAARPPLPGAKRLAAAKGKAASSNSQHVREQRPESGPSASEQQSLGKALSGILEQARATAKERGWEPDESNSNSNSNSGRRNKRLPLIGRATSSNTAASGDRASLLSRTSSIDTDGDGGNESANNTDAGNNRPHSLSLLGGGGGGGGAGGGRFDDDTSSSLYGRPQFDDDVPAMTQLNYEDPDAVAARRGLLQAAGRIVDENDCGPQQFIAESEARISLRRRKDMD